MSKQIKQMIYPKFFYELTISSSPHVHGSLTTQSVMRDVLIALSPALIGSVVFFGFRALLLTIVSAAACMFFEWVYRKIMRPPSGGSFHLIACSSPSNTGALKNSPSVMSSPSQSILMVSSLGF